MISFGRWGKYGGRSYFFTHRNPKNGDVWADLIQVKVGKEILCGKWVPSDKVKWE